MLGGFHLHEMLLRGVVDRSLHFSAGRSLRCVVDGLYELGAGVNLLERAFIFHDAEAATARPGWITGT